MANIITGNKGEWSEIYTLFKLLGDGKVYAGDAKMNKLPLYYPILSIIRDDTLNYSFTPDVDRNSVSILEEGQEVANIPTRRFLEESQKLLEGIKHGGRGKGAFAIPRAEKFMHEIHCSRLKAPSKDKADIHVITHDFRTNMSPMLGFSIKSQLGSPSTLLNAGIPTNVKFKVNGISSDEEMNQINAIQKHIPRITALYKKGGTLQYESIENCTFRNNLLFIDNNLPRFIGECLIADSITKGSSVKSAVEFVANKNPLHFEGNAQSYYEHKMKQLLIASALGMTPAKEWSGHFDANGGYLVVRKDGEIVCYHFYNQNDVEDYLFNNTRFERASRNRYNFGSIYKEEDSYYMRLNLQIRFTK